MAQTSKIVSSANVVELTGTSLTGAIPITRLQEWAPAWFYSALSWLGKSYVDAGNSTQAFQRYLIGSDVDPYAELGSTRLFVIELQDGAYVLSIAADVNSTAQPSTGTRYGISDAGILSMYKDLAASSIFSAVKYCAIPTLYARSVPSESVEPAAGLESGYDPATGIRVIVEGSAIAQVVPLEEFTARHNEQIYDEDPQIVPIVSALVYDVTQNNAVGAKTFTLPIYYARDQIGGTYYVNRLATTTPLDDATVACGQTALFPGGPGYDDTRAVALNVSGTAIADSGGQTVSTYTFDKAKVITFIPILPRVDAGVCTLTYSGSSPLAIFAHQRIVGFYQDPSWDTCLGVPIYDYGTANDSFTNTATALAAPELIYGTADEFLNGGSLRNVLAKLEQATYLTSTDRLRAILDAAIAVRERATASG